QALRSFDEMIHNENMLANISKLGAVGAAAISGAFIGMLIGASAFAMPVVGAILTAAIAAGVSFKLATMIHKHLQKSETTFSAIDGDNRFKLIESEWRNLEAQGFNPYAVNEAIRELAIEMKHTDANSLLFLGQAMKRRGEIIDSIRLLKSGKIK